MLLLSVRWLTGDFWRGVGGVGVDTPFSLAEVH